MNTTSSSTSAMKFKKPMCNVIAICQSPYSHSYSHSHSLPAFDRRSPDRRNLVPLNLQKPLKNRNFVSTTHSQQATSRNAKRFRFSQFLAPGLPLFRRARQIRQVNERQRNKKEKLKSIPIILRRADFMREFPCKTISAACRVFFKTGIFCS